MKEMSAVIPCRDVGGDQGGDDDSDECDDPMQGRRW